MAYKKYTEEDLTKEHITELPHVHPGCAICRLPVEDVKELSRLKFIERMSYDKIRTLLVEQYNIRYNMELVHAHFTKHTVEGLKSSLINKKDLIIATQLEKLSPLNEEAPATSIQTAYKYLTDICLKLSHGAYGMFTPYLEHLQNMPIEQLMEKIDRKNPLDVLEQMTKIQKFLSEHTKSLSDMRAPKVVLAQFLELAINDIIKQTGYIFAELCKSMELDLTHELKALNIEKVSSRAFTRTFQKSAEKFKYVMLDLKRNQLAKTIEALSELDKLV
jgi:hypothetical protein